MRAELIFKIQVVLHRYAPSNSGFHVCLQQRLDPTDDLLAMQANEDSRFRRLKPRQAALTLLPTVQTPDYGLPLPSAC